MKVKVGWEIKYLADLSLILRRSVALLLQGGYFLKHAKLELALCRLTSMVLLGSRNNHGLDAT